MEKLKKALEEINIDIYTRLFLEKMKGLQGLEEDNQKVYDYLTFKIKTATISLLVAGYKGKQMMDMCNKIEHSRTPEEMENLTFSHYQQIYQNLNT